MESIEDRVKIVLNDVLTVAPTQVYLQSKLVTDLQMDSLDFLEILIELEAEFEMEIPDHIAEKFVTVSDVIDYIRENQNTLVACSNSKIKTVNINQGAMQ